MTSSIQNYKSIRFNRNDRPARGNSTIDEPLPEDQFLSAISQERQRSERSRKPFLLMLATFSDSLSNPVSAPVIHASVDVLRNSIRMTDVIGWHRNEQVLGVIFTELGNTPKDAALGAVKNRMADILQNNLEAGEPVAIKLSFHWFPEDPVPPPGGSLDLSVYPECQRRAQSKKMARGIKRILDIVGSALALVFLSWLFLGIVILIKLTSKGPALFRQVRIGQHGKQFTFLKFRSMRVNNDATIHKEYVTKFISGKTDLPEAGTLEVFKITNDPRVTPIGRFLRKTSFDELPQLINVLKGEMSLIGPRPPLPYEFECYDLWHRRRVMEVKPGITGLWQVSGRSRTSFDEMVRLDLHYTRNWSLWLDFTILLDTPRAVLFGDGAY